jgi:ABC-type Fe3+-siderophore transport system permease subunit
MRTPEALTPASPPAALPDLDDPSREAAAAVHVGLWVSATRCLLTYVVAPLAGAVGVFLGPIGFLLQVCGAITATAGAHRLWVLHSRLRYPYLALALAVDALALVALVDLTGPMLGSVLR